MTDFCEECDEPTRETVPALIGGRPGRVSICKPCQEEHEHEANGEIRCEGCGEWISDDGAKFCPPCAAEEQAARGEAAHDWMTNR